MRPAIRACLEGFVASDPRRTLILAELRKSPEVRALLDKQDGAAPFVPDGIRPGVRSARPCLGYWWRLNLMRFWDGVVGATIGYGRKPERAAL